MPCLNEAETLRQCIEKARAFLERSRIDGEILIADNGSTDGSAEIARAQGARVVHVPIRGYGSALIAGIRASRGRFVIMGDSDNSYDFDALDGFVGRLREGNQLVIPFRDSVPLTRGQAAALKLCDGTRTVAEICAMLLADPSYEVHDPGEVVQQLEMAEQLVESMTSKWKPERYEDTWHRDVSALIERKLESGDTEPAEPPALPEPKGTRVVDLMPLLQRSLQRNKRGGSDGRSRKKARKPARAAHERSAASSPTNTQRSGCSRWPARDAASTNTSTESFVSPVTELKSRRRDSKNGAIPAFSRTRSIVSNVSSPVFEMTPSRTSRRRRSSRTPGTYG